MQVYHPCVLQTKKRYVGMMYESPGQAEPSFDAKGIETVRRDSCPAVAKMLERSLRLLFATRDVSEVGLAPARSSHDCHVQHAGCAERWCGASYS